MQNNKRHTSKQILVIGSIAYDHLFQYEGLFSQKILSNSIGQISLSFLVDEHRINFGGCGANIAYHLRKKGEQPLLVGSVGHDFQKYEKWLKENKINISGIIKNNRLPTSAAFILTDQAGAQITFFDPGASRAFSPARFPELGNIDFAIVAPTDRNLMKYGMDTCSKKKIPFFFDPGQMVHNFSSIELKKYLKKSAGLFVNQYEMMLFQKKTKWNLAQLVQSCPLVIETLAAKGSRIYCRGKQIDIPAIKPKRIINPTGCGDAYRAGFLAELGKIYPDYNLNNLQKAGRQGSRLASQVISRISQ